MNENIITKLNGEILKLKPESDKTNTDKTVDNKTVFLCKKEENNSKTIEITADEGEIVTEKSFVCIYKKENLKVDFSKTKVTSSSVFIEIKECKNVQICGLDLVDTCASDFAIRIVKSDGITVLGSKIKAKTGAISVSKSDDVNIISCSFFAQDRGNGVCITDGSSVKISNCLFEEIGGECVTAVDDNGKITITDNTFKRVATGIRVVGNAVVSITNNYFLSLFEAIVFYPSIVSVSKKGVNEAEIKYNLFDECATGGGLATVNIVSDSEEKDGENARASVISKANCGENAQDETGDETVDEQGEFSTKRYTYRHITVESNCFSQLKRAVIYAVGVEELTFLYNDVRSDGMNTVLNSVVNGIEA